MGRVCIERKARHRGTVDRGRHSVVVAHLPTVDRKAGESRGRGVRAAGRAPLKRPVPASPVAGHGNPVVRVQHRESLPAGSAGVAPHWFGEQHSIEGGTCEPDESRRRRVFGPDCDVGDSGHCGMSASGEDYRQPSGLTAPHEFGIGQDRGEGPSGSRAARSPQSLTGTPSDTDLCKSGLFGMKASNSA